MRWIRQPMLGELDWVEKMSEKEARAMTDWLEKARAGCLEHCENGLVFPETMNANQNSRRTQPCPNAFEHQRAATKMAEAEAETLDAVLFNLPRGNAAARRVIEALRRPQDG